MEFIKKIQDKLHDRMIKRQIAESKNIRSSIAFAKAEQIGVLFNASELADRKTVLSYIEKLKKQDKKIKLLGYLNEKEIQPDFTFAHFANQDLSWIGKNKSPAVDDFVQAKIDMLFCLHDDQPLIDIAARSNASLRVGPATEVIYPFEIMIEKGNMKLEKFIEQIEFFVSKVNRKENV